MSDGPQFATGFARVTREVTRRLSERPGIDIACLGWASDGVATNPGDHPIRVYPGSATSNGQDTIESVVADFKPDVLVTLGEFRMVKWLASHGVRKKFKWVGYLPLDGGPFYPPWAVTLREMEEIIAMSHFGRGVLQSGVGSREIRMIYHGVDCEVMKALPNRQEIKTHPRFRGKFVVGCIARNQWRKNIPALVQAFSLLVRRYPDLHLYIQSASSSTGYDLPELLKRYELQGCADLAAPNYSVTNGLSDSQMNELYNLFDVTVLPTCAEGFGLPLLESMAAGVPIVATDFSACSELVRGHGELAAVKTIITLGESLLDQAIVDVEDLARCIEKLYLSPELRQQYGQAGRAFAETLSWDRLMPQWLDVLSKVSGVDL
ncbi:MAG: glycosyltransferase family 4 protein [Verrucomicrobia bacterium]|nr:glycosyltransferase family 4 protein [Verrucomicrobiota bacterium]